MDYLNDKFVRQPWFNSIFKMYTSGSLTKPVINWYGPTLLLTIIIIMYDLSTAFDDLNAFVCLLINAENRQ